MFFPGLLTVGNVNNVNKRLRLAVVLCELLCTWWKIVLPSEFCFYGAVICGVSDILMGGVSTFLSDPVSIYSIDVPESKNILVIGSL